jgi:hypothetical protein
LALPIDMAASDPQPLNCPHCRQRVNILKDQNAKRAVYHCLRHGRFWIDDDGRLREERRSADRPKQRG